MCGCVCLSSVHAGDWLISPEDVLYIRIERGASLLCLIPKLNYTLNLPTEHTARENAVDCLCVSVFVCERVCVYVCVCVRACVHVYVHVCTCIHA